MGHPISTSQPLAQTGGPPGRIARVVVTGGAVLGALLVLAAGVLWLRYGSAVFFEMIASGFAACF